jgi:hypothetical protein
VGHLGCLHRLAIVDNAAIIMGVQVPLWNLTHIPLSISVGVGLSSIVIFKAPQVILTCSNLRNTVSQQRLENYNLQLPIFVNKV